MWANSAAVDRPALARKLSSLAADTTASDFIPRKHAAPNLELATAAVHSVRQSVAGVDAAVMRIAFARLQQTQTIDRLTATESRDDLEPHDHALRTVLNCQLQRHTRYGITFLSCNLLHSLPLLNTPHQL